MKWTMPGAQSSQQQSNAPGAGPLHGEPVLSGIGEEPFHTVFVLGAGQMFVVHGDLPESAPPVAALSQPCS